MSCAIEHGKETKKYYLPSKITVSGKRTNLIAGVSGPLLLWYACQWYEPQITHHHLSAVWSSRWQHKGHQTLPGHIFTPGSWGNMVTL